MPLEPREVCLLQSSALGAAGIGDQERRLLRSHNARVFSFRSSKLCPFKRPLPNLAGPPRQDLFGKGLLKATVIKAKCIMKHSDFPSRLRVDASMPRVPTPQPCAGETSSRSCSSKAVPAQLCGTLARVMCASQAPAQRPRNLKLPRSKWSWNSTRSYQSLSSSGISSNGTSPAMCRGASKPASSKHF